MSDDPEIDPEAWEPQAPPADFAERVMAQVRADRDGIAEGEGAVPRLADARPRRGRLGRAGVGAGVVAVLAVAAALALRLGGHPDARGQAIARERVEVSIGARARAVLEAGAEVRWEGDEVVQAHGDVFYRVAPGGRFRVHTPAGDVEVKGTCFAVKVRGEGASSEVEGTNMDRRDVKSGVVGAALSALAFVAVYEGKVAVSHAGERVDLGAGESAQASGSGVARSGELGAGERSFDAQVAASGAGEAPLAKANENLVAQVSEYRGRLEAIAAQKIELEQKLKKTEETLASTGDGGAARARAEYDLSQEDWVDLAKKGTVKFRFPCMRAEGWSPDAKKLAELGLTTQDGATLKDAYERSHQRLWKELRPMCAAAIGTTTDVADKIGPDACIHLIHDAASKDNRDAAAEAQTQAAEIRAGLRPEPAPGAKVHPVLKMFLLLTGANGAFEGDLAQSFGPDEAHRLAVGDDLCMSNNRWGGGKKREP
jgi:hypothetical protein